MRIEWRPAAKADLHDLLVHISRDSVAAAFSVHDRVTAAVEALGQHPRRGRPGRVAGTRELVIPRIPYLVVYQPGDPIVILRVLHGARRWPPTP